MSHNFCLKSMSNLFAKSAPSFGLSSLIGVKTSSRMHLKLETIFALSTVVTPHICYRNCSKTSFSAFCYSIRKAGLPNLALSLTNCYAEFCAQIALTLLYFTKAPQNNYKFAVASNNLCCLLNSSSKIGYLNACKRSS